MKKLIIATILFLLSSTSSYASIHCGFKPMAPFGCNSNQAMCICDQYGRNCHWEYLNCN